jgi:PAS domain S-box-containing protein
MKARAAFRSVNPYLGAFAVLLLLAALLSAIYFTWFELQWTAFLAGILMAAVLAMVGRASRAEWTIARRNAQLALTRQKSAQDAAARQRLEKELAAAREAARYLDEEFPVMVSYVDAGQQVLYHNRAFRDWMGKPASSINGRQLREVVGQHDYKEIETGVKDALAGRLVRFERTRRTPDGRLFRLGVEYLPRFGKDAAVAGFFAVLTDITSRSDVAAPAKDSQESYAESMAEQLTGWDNVGDRLEAAFQNNEFRLYAQAIAPLSAAAADGPPMHEILVRLKEEEENLMPPGAFLPLIERHGMLPDLDRWVTTNVVEWVAHDPARRDLICSVNVSGATMSDPNFAQFVVETLRANRMPGKVLCFEFTESVAAEKEGDVSSFVAAMREAGCRTALSQFGRSEVAFKLLKAFAVDYLKVDGNIVLNMLRDRVALAKLRAITRVAKSMGIATIAELVENSETVTILREVGVDFAQGFGVAIPRPIEELEHAKAAPAVSDFSK